MHVSRPLAALALVVSSSVALYAGCATAGSSGGDGGIGGGVCDGGLAACGSSCVDTSKDSKNCGTCGNACPTDQACVSGTCSLSCGTKTKCGQTCVTTATDPSNCGGCNKACDSGLSCVASQCTLVCNADAGQTKCTDKCVDTQFDNANCGSCSTLCDTDGGGGCQKGLCCAPGTANCTGSCIDTQADPLNCGQCKNVCPAQTPNCALGKCTALQVLGKLGSQTFYKVPVTGVMSDTNVYNACIAAGLKVGCQAVGCNYNDSLCVLTLESSCGNPMLGLSASLGCGLPSSCAPLAGVYQYMGHKWQSDSACGVENGTWCSTGNAYSNRWALCVQ
jgi:hypothetical protein